MPELGRTYPIPRPSGGIGRISHKLLAEVAAALAAHGFPEIAGVGDQGRLHRALERFIYGTDEQPGTPRSAAVAMHAGDVEHGAKVTSLRNDRL